MRESWVQPLSWEDPLEEGMATHSSILAWRIPMDRGAGQRSLAGEPMATVHGVAKSRQTLFSWAPKLLQMLTAAMKLKDTGFLEEKL